jgi:hypothetical protein
MILHDYIMLYHIILCYNIISHYVILYCTMSYYIVSFFENILYLFMISCTILYYITLHLIIYMSTICKYIYVCVGDLTTITDMNVHNHY